MTHSQIACDENPRRKYFIKKHILELNIIAYVSYNYGRCSNKITQF